MEGLKPYLLILLEYDIIYLKCKWILRIYRQPKQTYTTFNLFIFINYICKHHSNLIINCLIPFSLLPYPSIFWSFLISCSFTSDARSYCLQLSSTVREAAGGDVPVLLFTLFQISFSDGFDCHVGMGPPGQLCWHLHLGLELEVAWSHWGSIYCPGSHATVHILYCVWWKFSPTYWSNNPLKILVFTYQHFEKKIHYFQLVLSI